MNISVRKIAAVLLVIFLLLQLYQPRRNKESIVNDRDDFMNFYNIPVHINTLLKTSCYDCHSNNTTYAWYDYIQPGRMFAEHHIREAKAELNFSEWGQYSDRKKSRLLASIKKQVETQKMPLPSYLWLHGNARLSEKETKMLAGWADSLNVKTGINRLR